MRGGKQGEVHGEGLAGTQPATLANLPAQVLGGALRQRGDSPESARVGHGRRENGVPDVVHPALDDGVLDAEQLGDARLERHGSPLPDAAWGVPAPYRQTIVVAAATWSTKVGRPEHSREIQPSFYEGTYHL